MIRRVFVAALAMVGLAGGCAKPKPTLTVKPITAFSVTGVSLRDAPSALDKLQGLKSVGDEMVADHSRGIEFGVEQGRISYFLLRWNDPFLKDVHSRPLTHGVFSGPVVIAGQKVTFTEKSTEADVIAALGEPYWRNADDREVLLFYEYPEVEIQIELTPNGPIRILLASDVPTLADPKQRESYGVNKPWPPQ